jgi:hypothetical protein
VALELQELLLLLPALPALLLLLLLLLLGCCEGAVSAVLDSHAVLMLTVPVGSWTAAAVQASLVLDSARVAVLHNCYCCCCCRLDPLLLLLLDL